MTWKQRRDLIAILCGEPFLEMPHALRAMDDYLLFMTYLVRVARERRQQEEQQ